MINIKNKKSVRHLMRLYRYYIRNRVPIRKRVYRRMSEQIKERGHCRILFIASSLSMWRYQELVKLLLDDNRFTVMVAVIPFKAFMADDRRRDIETLKDYFMQTGIPFETVTDFKSLKEQFAPDIIAYQQPYDRNYDDPNADWMHNVDRMLMYVPYSVLMTEFDYGYNLPFHNVVWRNYVTSDIHQEISRRIADNRGENTVVVGEPRADQLLRPAQSDPWKKVADGKERKRLIWASHFSVTPHDMFGRPDFNWSYKVMREIAEEFADRLQIAFKPHPRLKSELYKHSDWGKERTDEFYAFWENSPNTQLETGDYLDLFKTSDAMIHNCGSFTVEYVYLQKPVAYITRDLPGIKADMNAFGAACQDVHYTTSTDDEIRRFITDVVLNGHDPMASKREEIFETALRTPNGTTVAHNIYNDLVKSLFE